jgi:hypothetical protein
MNDQTGCSISSSELFQQITPEEFADALLIEHSQEQLSAYLPDSQPQIPDNPWTYAEKILKVKLIPDQTKILKACLNPPYRVLADAGHVVGKTFVAAVLASWWYDYYDPGVIITTAPTSEAVKSVFWIELRLLRARLPWKTPWVGPKAPGIWHHPEHWAMGYTTSSGEAFQGRHREHMLFLFDESEGIEHTYFETTTTMFRPEPGNCWLCIDNPLTTESAAYLASQTVDRQTGLPAWSVLSMSALDHPNITGEGPQIPGAVSPAMVDQWVTDYGCDLVKLEDRRATDFDWRGKIYRPGPIAEARILGRRPSAGTYGIWSQALWQAALKPSDAHVVHCHRLPQIGWDVAYMGDDYSAGHVQWAGVSQHHETHNGWSAVQAAQRLKELAYEYAEKWALANLPRQLGPIEEVIDAYVGKIPIFVDDVHGGGVTSLCQSFGLNAIATNAASTSRLPYLYPNKRSELWFCVADLANRGMISFSLLDSLTLARLRSQAMAPTWKPNTAGQRVVEEKLKTKDKIGRSPDDMDAVNLAFLPWDAEPIPACIQAQSRQRRPGEAGSAQERRGYLRGNGEQRDNTIRRPVDDQGQSRQFNNVSRGYARYNRGA